MILGFLMVTAALVVSLGRLGDMYGRVRMYNLGFSVLTAFSILLAVTPLHRTGGALWLIAMRIDQRRGGDCRHAVGLIVGGVLAPLDWRLVFPVSG